MNRCGGAGLIAPCRVQLLSLNQPCGAISGDRRAKRLQPAISLRLSAAIKHPPSIGDRRGGHTFSRRSAAREPFPEAALHGKPRGRYRPWSLRPRRPRRWFCHTPPAAVSVVQMFAGKWGSRPPEYMSRSNDVVCNFASAAAAIILSLF